MNKDARDAFLRETRIAKLATLYADGAPTIVPVWFEWDGQTATVFTSRASPKVARILAHAEVALSVEEPAGVPEAWVTIDGTATIEEAGGMELARRLAQRYYAAERAAAAITEWEKLEHLWVVVRITPQRIRSSS